MGMGMGLMMPAMFSQYFSGKPSDPQQPAAAETIACPDCQSAIGQNAKFCPQCGHQQLVFNQCTQCGKNLTPNAKFCSRCGQPAEEKQTPKFCSQCGSENEPDSMFCNQCGEKI